MFPVVVCFQFYFLCSLSVLMKSVHLKLKYLGGSNFYKYKIVDYCQMLLILFFTLRLKLFAPVLSITSTIFNRSIGPSIKSSMSTVSKAQKMHKWINIMCYIICLNILFIFYNTFVIYNFCGYWYSFNIWGCVTKNILKCKWFIYNLNMYLMFWGINLCI